MGSVRASIYITSVISTLVPPRTHLIVLVGHQLLSEVVCARKALQGRSGTDGGHEHGQRGRDACGVSLPRPEHTRAKKETASESIPP